MNSPLSPLFILSQKRQKKMMITRSMYKRYEIPFWNGWNGSDWVQYAEASLRLSAEAWRLKRKFKAWERVDKSVQKP
jgi:hypothetical protein